jgi:hypothetical protein
MYRIIYSLFLFIIFSPASNAQKKVKSVAVLHPHEVKKPAFTDSARLVEKFKQ